MSSECQTTRLGFGRIRSPPVLPQQIVQERRADPVRLGLALAVGGRVQLEGIAHLGTVRGKEIPSNVLKYRIAELAHWGGIIQKINLCRMHIS